MQPFRHLVTLTAALALSAIAPQLYAQTTRIAVVDLQRAVLETEDGRAAQERLERLMSKRQSEIDAEREAFEELQQLTKRQWPALNERAKAQKAEEVRAAGAALQTHYTELQRELAERQAEETREILGRMERIISHLGQTDGYTVILERTTGGVVWSPANLDLTDVLIQRYNAGEGRAGAGPTPRARSRRRPRSQPPARAPAED